MKTKAIFYHAGCSVCVQAEHMVAETIDKERYDVEIVNLGEVKERLDEAEEKGVKSVPALVVSDQPFHINFGASITDLR